MIDHNSAIDFVAGAGLLLFASGSFSDIEIVQSISSFGGTVILYMWLKETKKQMKEMNQLFLLEQNEVRKEHKDHIDELKGIFNDYKNRLDNQLKDKDSTIKILSEKK
jgi:hypothetical protein